MPEILYIEHSGAEHLIEADVGKSVMQIALDNMVPGIVGDCGGCCTCATCHAYVDPAWIPLVPPPSNDETMMLEGALSVEPNSRLTCQIKFQPELDGLVVRLPESQF